MLGWKLASSLKKKFLRWCFFLWILQDCLSTQSWTKHWRQILEIKQKYIFLWNVLEMIFYNFLAELKKFSFRVASRTFFFITSILVHSLKFSNFVKVLRLKLFDKLWGNSYTPYMVTITYVKTWKSLYMFCQRLHLIYEHLRTTDSAHW